MGMLAKSALNVALSMLVVSVVGCGSRTGFGENQDDSAAPTGSTTSPIDVCPSAIQVGAPKAMPGNCSTRDGRTRAAAPRSPHIKWTTLIPVPVPTGSTPGPIGLGIAGLVTDVSGNLFLSSYDNAGDASAFRKIDSRGNVSWASNFSDQTPTPYLTTGGSLLTFGGPPVAISAVDAKTGAMSQIKSLGFEHRNVLDPAIGRDGSLYFVHETGENLADLAISRSDANGNIVWTSAPFSTPNADISEVSLGNDDMVLVAASFEDKSNTSNVSTTVYAYDPASGNALWTRTFISTLTSDLRVRADGSIVFSLLVTDSSDPVIVLAPNGAVLASWFSGFPESVVGVAANGGVLVYDSSYLSAVDARGLLLWKKLFEGAFFNDLTIATNDIILATDPSGITAIDWSTGNVVWTLAAPSSAGCLLATTLNSQGDLIAVQCDGTVFAAGD